MVLALILYCRAVFGKDKILNHEGLIDPNPVHFFHEDNGNNVYFSEIRFVVLLNAISILLKI